MGAVPQVSVVRALDRAADFAARGRLAAFCGAGISKPGGLPDAIQLVRAILEWTSMTAGEKQWVTSIVPKRLPLERLMETVLDALNDQDRENFLAVFRLGSPAIAHAFIAAAAKRHYLSAIFTTNFDCHLEAALSRNGVALGSDVVVHHDINFALGSIADAGVLRLLKLHGSVDLPKEMAVTVRAVSKMESVAAINRVIGRAMDQPDSGMIVFGYSFSDRFDISPAFERATKSGAQTGVFVVDHAPGVESDGAEVLPFDGSGEVPHPLRDCSTAVRIRADTAWVIRELGSRLDIDSSSALGVPVEWGPFLKEFGESLDDRNGGLARDTVAGLLLEMIGAHDAAIPYLSRTVERIAKGNEPSRLATSQALVGALSAAGRLDEARELAFKTESLAREFEGGKHADTILSYLGSIHKQLAEDNLVRSRDYYYKAAKIAAKDGVGLRCVPHIAGIAAAWMRLGDMDAALAWYMQSYEAVKVSGDPSREAEVCGNIASLHYTIREYESALEWYERAIALSRLSGDERNLAIHLLNRANVFVKRKCFEAAAADFANARAMLGEGDPLTGLLDSHAATAKRLAAEAMSQAGP